MTAKAILDIDIGGQEFDKFFAEYKEFQKMLDGGPEKIAQMSKEWAKVNAQFDKANAALNPLAPQNHDADKERFRRLSDSEKLWSSMARHSQNIAKNVLDVGSGL